MSGLYKTQTDIKMKKIFLAAILLIVSSVSYSQWTSKVIKSDFDGSFKKSYTQSYNRGYLVMEQPSNEEYPKSPFFALSGSYFCDDTGHIDFVLIVKGEKKHYVFRATKSRDSRLYYFDENVWSEEFIFDFKNASKCLIRVNQEYCTDDYYEFNMSGSAQAYNFLVPN